MNDPRLMRYRSGLSIRTKLMLTFTTLLVVPMLMVTLISIKVLTSNARRELEENTSRALVLGEKFLLQRIQETERTAALISGMEDMHRALEHDMVREFTVTLRDLHFTDLVEVFDRNGLPLARSSPNRKGIDRFHTTQESDILLSAMDLQSRSDLYSSRAGLAVKASAPILNIADFRLDGVVAVTLPLDIVFLTAMKNAVNCDVSVFTEQAGMVSTLQGPDGKRTDKFPLDQAAQDALSADERNIRTNSIHFGREYHTVSAALKNHDGRILGVLTVYQSTGGIAAISAGILKTILITSGFSLVLILVLGIYSARTMTRPLGRLLDGVQDISNGNYDQRVHISQRDEFGMLASSFNSMAAGIQAHRTALLDAIDEKDTAAERLEEANLELERFNQELERLVAERTAELSRSNERLRTQISERAMIQLDLEQAKEAADSANTAKTEFLAGMSHEIRTPMNAILGMAELLGESDLDGEQKHYVEILHTAGEGLLALINDILDLSKVEAGELALEWIPFSPRELVTETCKVMEPNIRKKGLDFSLDLPGGLPDTVMGDPNRLRQVLVNLLANAAKFTEKGEVRLAARYHGQDAGGENSPVLQFSISDTGIGIPKNRLDRIFDKFSQADASTTRRYGGTGLGLAICKQLATMMGGDIHVESEPERGSTFHFSVCCGAPGSDPVPEWPTTRRRSPAEASPQADQAEQAGPEKDASVPAVPVRPLHILLAEDNKAGSLLITHYLRSTPHTADTAATGKEAVRLFMENTYDIVFMDIEMPDMDGYEATRAIRDMEHVDKRPRTPVVALTAHASDEAESEARRAGCDGRLAKPISKDRLLRALSKFI